MWTSMPRALFRAFVVVAAIAVFVPAAQAIEARQSDGEPATRASDQHVLALYNGQVIDLAEDWSGAQTCVAVPDELAFAECFDTDQERDDRLAQLGLTERFDDAAPEGMSFAAASCSSSLKLYDGYYYTGTSLWLSTRGTWTNLSTYGFNQRASSYKVGGCSTYMADYSNGGGAWISTSLTQAWDVDAVISGSWNNDISSVYIL